jgi:hypothetical protein
MTTRKRAMEIKRRADGVLEDVFRALFEEIDTAKIRDEVSRLKATTPDFEPARQARTLARRTAIRCAAAGAVTGLPSGVVAMGILGADLAYLVYQSFRLILGIAAVYGHEPSGRERFAEAMSCFAYASGVGIGKQGIATVLGERFVRERAAKMVPFVGVVSGGALNYMSVHAVARVAMHYYEQRIDSALADEIWSEGDREHA